MRCTMTTPGMTIEVEGWLFVTVRAYMRHTQMRPSYKTGTTTTRRYLKNATLHGDCATGTIGACRIR